MSVRKAKNRPWISLGEFTDREMEKEYLEHEMRGIVKWLKPVLFF